MVDIISLSKARKAKVRQKKERQAAENRVMFGRSKAEKLRDALVRERAQRLAEAHRRDD